MYSLRAAAPAEAQAVSFLIRCIFALLSRAPSWMVLGLKLETVFRERHNTYYLNVWTLQVTYTTVPKTVVARTSYEYWLLVRPPY